jgi:hypothetical protein
VDLSGDRLRRLLKKVIAGKEPERAIEKKQDLAKKSTKQADLNMLR